MKVGMGLRRAWLVCGIASLSLGTSGCTLLSTGFATSSPGVNKHSFQECLLDNGFFGGVPLTGYSADRYEKRREAEKSKPDYQPPEDRNFDTMSDARFGALTLKTIHDGFFPRQQYNDPEALKDATEEQARVADPAHNRPYINSLSGGHPVTTDDKPPPPADPPGLNLPVNRYLDCYLGPVGAEPRTAANAPILPAEALIQKRSINGDYDREGRLLRAHILLTMLAAYGTELVTSRPNTAQAEQATRLLGHLRDAELALRSPSMVMNPEARRKLVEADIVTPDPKPAAPAVPTQPVPKTKAVAAKKPAPVETPPASAADVKAAALKARDDAADKAAKLQIASDRPGALDGHGIVQLRWYAYTTRLLRVFQIGVDVETIDTKQSLDRLTNIITAFSNPTPAAFKNILGDAIKGLGTVQTIQLYGAAMRFDATETLAGHRLNTIATPTATDSIPASWTYDVADEKARWQAWDVRLDRACKQLAGIAKQTDAGCVPKDDAMKQAFDDELPPLPAAPAEGVAK